MKKYAVKECFLTLQGEGAHAGSRAVFVRFAGCNVWSGREEDRARDTAKGACARWCDTAFVGTDGHRGGLYTAEELAQVVRTTWNMAGEKALAVFTGGEPALQLDEVLVHTLQAANVKVHVETNGSHALPGAVDWVTLSPKPPMKVVQGWADEVKVIYPCFDPLEYERFAGEGISFFVQPLDDLNRKANLQACIDFVLKHPRWRISLQQHKILNLP